MKVSPIPTLSPTAPAAPLNVRVMKMTTNATPGRVETDTPPASQLTIPDKADQTPAASEDTKPLNPQLADLAKQRRSLQVKERELADRERAIEGRSASGDHISLADLKADPLGALKKANVGYDQLTDAVIASTGSPEIEALKAEIKALREGVEKKLTDRDDQTKQQVLSDMTKTALKLVAEGDTYALVRETQSVPLAIQLIDRVYTKTGEVLTPEEALADIEAELMIDAERLIKVQKVQGRLSPSPMQPPQQHRQVRTLTNRDTASVPMSAKARAIAAFHGTLNKR